jgi:hypothetical protein
MWYKRLLNVSTPKGKRIEAVITQSGTNVNIRVDYLSVVEKDNPEFAKNGVISFTVAKTNYKETLHILTKYLEDLFLKGMSNENLYSSIGASSNKRRNAKKNKPRKVESTKREGDTSSIHDSARGNESA